MAIMFFVLITPLAIFLRMIGRDALLRKYDGESKSYWILREPAGPKPDSLTRQY
jgi:hypothetical protein